MKWSRVAAVEEQHVGADEARAVIGDRLDGGLDLRGRRREAGHERRHQHAGVDAGVGERLARRAAAAADARFPVRACARRLRSVVGTLT